ncbi:MAG TPA: hypothetical protein VKC11_00990 [Steroidobacteraceae bacterium]|nr:hypothetical protein [Steroidobacteraceae bacterium]
MNPSLSRVSNRFLMLVALTVLAGCGGGYGGGGGGGGGYSYTVGGTVTGLNGNGLVLRDNGGDDLAVSASGMFTFATKVANGAMYSVTVYVQPISPVQNCMVTSGSGTMGSINITTVAVSCTTVVSGTYVGVDYATSGNVGSLGTTSLDSMGHYTSTSDQNDAGSIVTAIADVGVYTVAAGGAMTIDTNVGAVSADGYMIVIADMTASDAAYIDVEVYQGQTNFVNADFSGTYEFVTYSNSGDSSTLSTIVADGLGGFTGSQVQNNGGVISSSSAISGTYAVGLDGSLTVIPTGGAALAGGIGTGGNRFVLSQLTAGQGPSFTVGVKQGQSTFTNASVSGAYQLVTHENSGDSGVLLKITFDGAGNISGMATANDLGVISSSVVTGTYSVTASGALTVSPTGGTPFTGGVSADGNAIVLASMNALDPPDVVIGVRL